MPSTFGRAFGQARDVSVETLVVPMRTTPRMRLQRRGIVGNARRRCRHGTYKGGFARVRKAKQADIGQYLQFQAQVTRLALGARDRLARRAVGRALEYRVACAAVPTDGHLQALPVRDQVADDFIGIDIDHGRADRHANHRILSFLAGHLQPMPFSPRCAGMRWWRKSISVFGPSSATSHPAAIAAVSAVGPAQRNEFLAPNDAAVAAVSGVYGIQLRLQTSFET
jgi:hypothetical protein